MVSTFTLKSLDSVNIPFPLMSADGPVPPEGVPPLITVHSNLSSLRCLTPEQSLPESKLQLRPTGREFKRVSFYSLCFSLKVFKSPFQCFYVGARKTVSNSKLECLPKLIFFFFFLPSCYPRPPDKLNCINYEIISSQILRGFVDISIVSRENLL